MKTLQSLFRSYIRPVIFLAFSGTGLSVHCQTILPAPGSPTAPATNLDFYLGQALQNSPLLKDYQNQVLTGQVDSQLVRAGYKPQVNGSSVNTYAPVIHGYGYDQAISNGGNFSTLVSVNQTLAGQKHLDAQFETIRLQNQGLRNTS